MEYYWELRCKDAQNIKALVCPLYVHSYGVGDKVPVPSPQWWGHPNNATNPPKVNCETLQSSGVLPNFTMSSPPLHKCKAPLAANFLAKVL